MRREIFSHGTVDESLVIFIDLYLESMYFNDLPEELWRAREAKG
jgi:hypothetical protein